MPLRQSTLPIDSSLQKEKEKKKIKAERKEKNKGIFLCKGQLSFTKKKMLPDEFHNIINQSKETFFLSFFPF